MVHNYITGHCICRTVQLFVGDSYVENTLIQQQVNSNDSYEYTYTIIVFTTSKQQYLLLF